MMSYRGRPYAGARLSSPQLKLIPPGQGVAYQLPSNEVLAVIYWQTGEVLES